MDTSRVTSLPSDHPLRVELNNEVHARPTPSLKGPLRVSYLVLLSANSDRESDWKHFCSLLAKYGQTAPELAPNYHLATLPDFSIVYERHTEFRRFTFLAPDPLDEDYFSTTALAKVPQEWLASLKGEVLVATHGVIAPGVQGRPAWEDLSERYFNGNALVGSLVGDESAAAITDFRLNPDGFSRFVIVDYKLTPRQAGRTLQRILEIDTYRMLALLALPIARRLAPLLNEYERQLSHVTQVLQKAEARDETALLEQLTHLEAQIESEQANNRFRFTAANAYDDLVKRRILELRESRIPGLQTFAEFTERRLAPAMNTCMTVAARQESVSEHIARANELLATRVDLTRQKQNQALLESMDRRAKAQFELQLTVEGLSVAAITYYVVGLIGYFVRGLHAIGWNVNYEVATAASIPCVLALLMVGLKRVHRSRPERQTKPDP